MSELRERMGKMEEMNVQLSKGIAMSFFHITKESQWKHHQISEHEMEIHYCKGGRIGWTTQNGNQVYLGPKDFFLHTKRACSDCRITLPNASYEGLCIKLDLREIEKFMPEILEEARIDEAQLQERYGTKDTFSSFVGNEETEAIFRFFYDQPERLRMAYRKLKLAELLLYLWKEHDQTGRKLTEYQVEQVEIVRRIHDQLMENLNQRITIDDLAKQYLMNPTTLKTVFKSVYGTSIAAHMKEHRMERAAAMLTESDETIAKIAQAVGYDSQSRFSSAFKGYFHVLPKEYRKKAYSEKCSNVN